MERLHPFFSTQTIQMLVQSHVILSIDHCRSLLAGLPLNTILPFQMIQNAAAHVAFWSSSTPPHCSAPSTGFLQLPALDLKNWCSPTKLKKTDQHPLTSKYLSDPALLHTSSDPPALLDWSQHLSVYKEGTHQESVPKWWNELPLYVQTAETLSFQKTYLFIKYLN